MTRVTAIGPDDCESVVESTHLRVGYDDGRVFTIRISDFGLHLIVENESQDGSKIAGLSILPAGRNAVMVLAKLADSVDMPE